MTTDFVYLASASPRRRALLEQIGVPFRSLVPSVDETHLSGEAPVDYVARVALAKADAVWDRVCSDEPAPVLAADTCVVIDSDILGKPADATAALGMLEQLSGRSHQVLTAVALRWQDARESAVVHNEVRFRATTPAERLAYCQSGEPFDKAGGYAIQGLGAVFVEYLSGSYSAVMGLPLCRTQQLLRRFALPAWLTASAENK